MTKPRVLISDALSPAAVQIFKDRGIDVDFQPDLGKDKDKLAAVIGDYDGLAIRSATKVTAKILEQAKNLKVIGRAGIGVDNVEIPAATAQGRDRDEHALRQFHHHRRACHRDDVRAGAPDPASRCVDPGRQVGEEPLHGRRAHRQDAGRHRLRQYRLDRCGARHRPAHEGHRLRSLPVAGEGDRDRGREGRTRRPSASRRRDHAARADDREDQEHPVGREHRQDQEGRADHQLRARRPRG